MASKVFKELDSWDDSAEYAGSMSFSTKRNKKEKINKSRKRNHSEIDADSFSGGTWVK